MTLYVNRPLHDKAIHVRMADINTLSANVYVPCPFNGTVVGIYGTTDAAHTGSTANVDLYINSTAVTNGRVAFPVSGSGAGTTRSATPSGANGVVEGDTLRLTVQQAGTGTVVGQFAIIIRT